ncbi:hypothetical protein GCM10010300_31000 [Streptomyces olivaceoviridis]|uniref:DUF6380 family protein n=1 Tax=Streptomyces olivaceoviridis TaxID=1921 RepID=UPI00199581BA|nr:hypothetical protein GCM10010300_31000 [Streptomyces olivaceoviridis]
MQRTAPEPAGPDGMRQSTFRRGVASLTATAGRAPFNHQARAPKGRGAVSDMRLPPRGHDRPRRSRSRKAALNGPARGAHARKDAR